MPSFPAATNRMSASRHELGHPLRARIAHTSYDGRRPTEVRVSRSLTLAVVPLALLALSPAAGAGGSSRAKEGRITAVTAAQWVVLGSRVAITGTVKPGSPGLGLALQQRVGGAWTTVAAKTVDGGAFTFFAEPGEPGHDGVPGRGRKGRTGRGRLVARRRQGAPLELPLRSVHAPVRRRSTHRSEQGERGGVRPRDHHGRRLLQPLERGRLGRLHP